jgi:hypothetical protein
MSATTTQFNHVSYLWDEAKAAELAGDEVALFIYRSNLLGADLRLTNYGGGNTSVKITDKDPLTGKKVEVMWIKGSGGDIGTLKKSGCAALYVERLRNLENVYRGVEFEDEMVELFNHCIFDLASKAPSIDTPLHGFLPFAHIDHLHPDAAIAIAAAKNYGARAVGIEYNKDMAALASRNAQRAGVSDKVKIIHGDIFVEDFSKATVLTMYLLPDLNLKLRPTILKMAPGTRVATNSFNMGDWEPDQVIGNGYAQGYFWVVPGNAAGKWTIKGINGGQGDVLELTQQYQKVGGTLTIKGKAQPILGGKLTGNRLKFSFVDEGGQSRHFDVELKGNTMQGNVLEMSPLYEVSGTRS